MWNADIYNRYDKERIQPSLDLANRLNHRSFKRILDVGCGTGMSTTVLHALWRQAEIIGVDLSAEMLAKAKEALPELKFLQRHCGKPLCDLGTFDLMFSNAFLQWIPNQEEFIANSFALLSDGGIFAAQIPLFEEMPANQCIIRAAEVLVPKLKDIDQDKYTLHSASEYYDMLSNSTSNVSIWVTDYCHEMEDYNKILDFLKGAALRPYMNKLKEGNQNIFLKQLLCNLKEVYACQKNGKVLFPFRRLFLIGEKKTAL